jgi:hypothetical protein
VTKLGPAGDVFGADVGHLANIRIPTNPDGPRLQGTIKHIQMYEDLSRVYSIENEHGRVTEVTFSEQEQLSRALQKGDHVIEDGKSYTIEKIRHKNIVSTKNERGYVFNHIYVDNLIPVINPFKVEPPSVNAASQPREYNGNKVFEIGTYTLPQQINRAHKLKVLEKWQTKDKVVRFRVQYGDKMTAQIDLETLHDYFASPSTSALAVPSSGEAAIRAERPDTDELQPGLMGQAISFVDETLGQLWGAEHLPRLGPFMNWMRGLVYTPELSSVEDVQAFLDSYNLPQHAKRAAQLAVSVGELSQQCRSDTTYLTDQQVQALHTDLLRSNVHENVSSTVNKQYSAGELQRDIRLKVKGGVNGQSSTQNELPSAVIPFPHMKTKPFEDSIVNLSSNDEWYQSFQSLLFLLYIIWAANRCLCRDRGKVKPFQNGVYDLKEAQKGGSKIHIRSHKRLSTGKKLILYKVR